MGFVEIASDSLYIDREMFAAAWNPATASPGNRHLPRFPIPEWVAKMLFPINETQPWDPQTYLRRPANIDFQWKLAEHAGGSVRYRTNSLGMRENEEPLATKPDLRILVTGDSHTEGVCNNVESFPHVLRRALLQRHPGRTIESLNAGKGAFSFYNYLGTLEKFLYLEPDVFVVAVYGPNDFQDVVATFHYFEGTPRAIGSDAYQATAKKAAAADGQWTSQEGLSLLFFQHYPSEIEVAVRAAKAAVLDMQELCEANGIGLAFVYIPGMLEVDRKREKRDPDLVRLGEEMYALAGIDTSRLDVHDRMGDELLAYLAERKIPCLDLRPVFAAGARRYFWREDHHIDVDAHQAIGEALAPVIESLQPAGLR